MKIYTKTGDDGTTGLIGGNRTTKADPRIECYGTVDELNAILGWTAVAVNPELRDMLRQIQNELFVIGAILATPLGASRSATIPDLNDSTIARLEAEIDEAEKQLAPLQQFILPGGGEPSARLHIARAVCRRAERLLVGFAANQPLMLALVTYLNRLSDWLFVQARFANHVEDIGDVPWEKSEGSAE